MGLFGTFPSTSNQFRPGSEQIVIENPEQLPAGETSNEAVSGPVVAWDDLETGFSGNPKTKLDERGRLKMPAEFKAFVDKKYGKGFSAFYITSRDGESAEIHPMPEWLKLQAKINKIPQSVEAVQRLREFYSLYGDRADMDPQGRMLLPEELRNEGNLVGDVKVNGRGTFLQVISLNKLRENVKQGPLSAAHKDVLTSYDI
jgi:MraZ protein